MHATLLSTVKPQGVHTIQSSTMNARSLRGGCHCGRNVYIIAAPKDTSEVAQVLFDTHPFHRISMANPLAAFIRVPLSWYHATTVSYFPDETSAMIHRVYTHPRERNTKRHFCGFCGTPLSYWSEEPRAEAEYIHLTLGSLCSEDLNDLEDLGVLPGGGDDEVEQLVDGTRAAAAAQRTGAAQAPREPVTSDNAAESFPSHQTPADMKLAAQAAGTTRGRETTGPSWFDSMMQGSRLGNLRTASGSRESDDGRIKLRWEVVEWTEGGEENSPNPGKRKLGDREEDGDQEMAGTEA